ncbi:YitT family protein [Peptostreptococcaceae bacterium OttesenSCG-928-C18]|nr:YitT family protein [Peptostreptococcaceae bacterium OttesenSCG-928-C18]
MKIKNFLYKCLFSFLGVVIITIGVAFLNVGNVGVDNFTAFNTALGKIFNLSLGTFQLLINIVFIIFVFIFGKKYIGFGTLITMTLIGFFIDFFTNLLSLYVTFEINFIIKVLFLIFGTLLFTFGISLYISADFGIAPFDAISMILVDYTNIKYKYIRMLQDLLFMTTALLLGGPVGIGTIITCFFNGPFIDFFYNKISDPLMKKL